MIFWIVVLGILYTLWRLLVEGVLWKLILLCAGWVGIRYLLLTYWPGAQHTAMIFLSYHISWAALIAAGICFMALLTTKE